MQVSLLPISWCHKWLEPKLLAKAPASAVKGPEENSSHRNPFLEYPSTFDYIGMIYFCNNSL